MVTDRWNGHLESLSPLRSDVYLLEEYVRVHERHGVTAECFVRQEDGHTYVLPYLRVENDLLGEGRYDVFTPYGYGGPVADSDDPGFLRDSFSDFAAETAERGGVAGFIRFLPGVTRPEALAGGPCEVAADRETVWIDLARDEEELWSGMQDGTRRMTKRAMRDLEYRADEDLDALPEFTDLYRSTMRRLGADDFYLFEGGYFDRLKEQLAGRSLLGLVYRGGDLLSAGLFLHDEVHGHYHLGGSAEDSLGLRPNNLMIFGTALHMRSKGLRSLHLGGGTDSTPDNSLLRFKRGFSRCGYLFQVGRVVFDPRAYQEAVTLWRAGGGSAGGRFPEYGAGGSGGRA